MRIDINCDMGERADVPEPEIMPWITSANVACGGHAGDQAAMERTLRLALQHGVAAGAHPGYPDPANFGREELAMSAEALSAAIYEQLSRLAEVAARLGCPLHHVKPHGALYNVAARRPEVGQAIADGVARWRSDVILVGLAGSSMLDVWREAGFRVAAEAFADRAYESDGTLRSRRLPGALLTDPEAAAAQALTLATSCKIDTICIHSDTPGAGALVRLVHIRLKSRRVLVQALE